MSSQQSYPITLKDGAIVEIVYGTAASRKLNAQPEILKTLIETGLRTTYEIPDLAFIRTRIQLRKLLLPLLTGIGEFSFLLNQRICLPILNLFYPSDWFFSPTLQEELAWGWNDAQKQLRCDSFALAKIGDEIVAISAYKPGGILSNKRHVFEITKSFTLPIARSRGLNTLLEQRIIQLIRHRHPGSAVMTMSKNQTIINRCKKMGWQQLSLAEYSQIIRRVNRSGISAEAIAVLQHWQCFLYDPDG